jgi:histidinol dehydrogenase
MKIITMDELFRKGFDLREATQVVIPIIHDVREQGDRALLKYARRFDRPDLKELVVSSEKVEQARSLVSQEVMQALQLAKEHIWSYHAAQLPQEWFMEITPGITAGQLIRPLSTVGCYIPGGKYPLVSTVLMTVVPARIAGVDKIVVCTPRAVPEILAACDLAGVDLIAEVGGAQAIAAMAYGTESIPKVDKIVGPGNRYVTAAKKAVYGDVGIDFLAGPSEVLVIADESGNPSYLAADLLAQAEHDEDAIAILVTPSRVLADHVLKEVDKQLSTLSTKSTAARSLEKNGFVVITNTIEEAFDISNQLAPEHLAIHLEDGKWLKKVKNAGSIFLGEYSAEVFGDYASGPNHVLPTGGMAAFQSGLGVMDFMKRIAVQRVNRNGASRIGKAVTTLARTEGLEAHARAVEIRTIGDAL